MRKYIPGNSRSVVGEQGRNRIAAKNGERMAKIGIGIEGISISLSDGRFRCALFISGYAEIDREEECKIKRIRMEKTRNSLDY